MYCDEHKNYILAWTKAKLKCMTLKLSLFLTKDKLQSKKRHSTRKNAGSIENVLLNTRFCARRVSMHKTVIDILVYFCLPQLL